ncbi:hypothetical protein LRY65_04235 [Candidatus Woesebacteria bacterium]|nr:hypothetical protein [Candidatus Woesebacteria bacterium]MCD8507546.1 hypothetical protein [Candidatus Woesebacteria bacterium]MCD8527387.1 hypothetical protein [Candidatus Woesebacteria bacterium]MCD8546134.1 hypothetical protein [Candidatus Woesebacteria bacterium]
MARPQYEQEVSINQQESRKVQEVLETLSDADKISIVIQSFMVGAGSIDAHTMYVQYLCTTFSLTPREGGLLLRKCFSTLNDENKRKIIQAAYHRHLDLMKKAVSTEKRTSQRLWGSVGNFEATIQSTSENLPTILGNNAFDDITPEEANIFQNLPKDFSPNMNSVLIQHLRKICDDRGYYNDREWRKALESG